MNKTKIKNFSVWARNKLIDEIRYRAGLMGITEDGIQTALPQSAGDTEFYDIGTAQPYAISGEAVGQRRKLVDAIREKERSSGYQTAYRYIVEEVAYTWFNRLIAIRFMEVNDYLPAHIRVLSSESGRLEPDLVASPFEADLPFTEEEKQTVLRLQQDNRIDELFRLLFIKQCNALNEILPGLFEKINDYTELLLSLSVIDRDGVVYRLTHEIDEDDFNIEKETGDGEGSGQVEIIGWLYQYWNTEPKDAVFGRPSGQKIKKEEIPAATQLFTPDWIVRYMVENSLGRLWVEGHPNKELKARWKYYLEEAEQESEVQAQLAGIRQEAAALKPEEIRCIDPCMGSGHILCRLFDVLMEIYESQGYSPRDAAQSIVQNNLYGLDIDKRATQLAYFSVMMKARHYDRKFLTRGIQPMVYSTTGDEEGENFGSLVLVDDPGERPEEPETMFDLIDHEKRLNAWNYRRLLAQKYHVVCTNPPYMGASNMNETLSNFIRDNYADYKSDFFSAFFARCSQMGLPTGKLGFFSPYVWMFIQSYEKLRYLLCQEKTIETLIQFEYSAFEEATVPVCTFVLSNYHVNKRGCYFRLTDFRGGMEVQRQKTLEAITNHDCGYYYEQCLDNFSKIPGRPVAYWISNQFISLLGEKKTIGNTQESGSGLSTADNNRFLRFFWEVDMLKIARNKTDSKKWYLFHKGGEFRKWYGNLFYVVNWENDGSEIKYWVTHNPNDPNTTSWSRRIFNTHLYFEMGITWSVISSGTISFRAIDTNAMISNAAGGIFGFADAKHRDKYMAALNSKIWTKIFSIINPTLNYSSGVIQKAPAPQMPDTTLGTDCVKLSKVDWDSYETSWDFKKHPLI